MVSETDEPERIVRQEHVVPSAEDSERVMLGKYVSGPMKHVARRLLSPAIPAHLARNHRPIDDDRLRLVDASINRHFHTGKWTEGTGPQEMLERDLTAHLHGRLDNDRKRVVPWLDSTGRLRGRRILEIGCGTGSSTVALAEQGAAVTGIDIDEGALAVARDRCAAYRVEADFRPLNAQALSGVFDAGTFDFIIFFACLEHMTIAERLTSLRDAWGMLPAGGRLAIVETPNRLWYYDSHTAILPFFHWLPDELAFRYSAFSPREGFRELYREYDAEAEAHFRRRGRGMSFHELDLAIQSVRELQVISSLSTYEGIRYRLRQSRLERQYKSLLRRIYPGIHEGFLDDTLYLVLRKP
jgi:S-adenosylmethionine-dependent methyltransferase